MPLDITALLEKVKNQISPDAPGPSLHRVCRTLRQQVSHYDWVGFYLAVPATRMLVLGPFDGAPTEHVRIPYGTGICGQAAVRGEMFVVQDVREETNYLACSIATRAEIVLPVTCKGQFAGELDIDSHTAAPFGSDDTELLETICELVAPLVAAVLPEPLPD